MAESAKIDVSTQNPQQPATIAAGRKQKLKTIPTVDPSLRGEIQNDNADTSKKQHLQLVFQLGTNNWQRQGEFAPGSGILHETHHRVLNNELKGKTKCYSIYPSKRQTNPENVDAQFRIFKLEHDIPICESISPVSSYRWHSMSEQDFNKYRQRLEREVYEYMAEIEEKEEMNFSLCLAHHTFLNPIVMRNVINRRVEEGKPRIPLFCFVHGTALKMYVHEMNGNNKVEYPYRFHGWMLKDGIFDDQENGITGCFAISNDQKKKLAEVFPSFPSDRVIISPNGVNQSIFHPCPESSLEALLQSHKPVWPQNIIEKNYKDCVVFVGKFANWKRLPALLHAAKLYEAENDEICTIIIGKGSEEDVKYHHDLAESLQLKNTFFLGAKPQPMLAEFFSVASVGCFPSYSEPFGMVFIECMCCGTPVIGVNSGGPRDFVSQSVGVLVPEPPNDPYDLDELSKELKKAIVQAVDENWKQYKGSNCIKLAQERFSVQKQVEEILSGVDELLNPGVA